MSSLRELKVGPCVVIGSIPLWLLTDPVVDLTLVEKRKDWSEVSDIRKRVDNYIGRSFFAFIMLFTDGSKDPDSGHTGAGIYIAEFDVQISVEAAEGRTVHNNDWNGANGMAFVFIMDPH